MTKADFIAEHVGSCQCMRAKKYDPKKPTEARHSLAYSRRKCAKKLWRELKQRTG